MLATSRERLGVAGEQVAVVPPLDVDAPTQVDAARRSPAAQLFIDRARLAVSGFDPDTATVPTIEAVCRRLEGLPLAIELAASRVRVLSLEQILARLDDRFRLLTSGATTSRRHQTLRAVMDWSYEALDEDDRRAFRRLSVFAGGWTLEAASAVLGMDEFDAIETLERLADKSLVVVDHAAGDEARYRMLETVREYAQERLDAAGEADEARAGHVRHFVGLAERCAPHSYGQPGDNAQLDGELGNLLAAHDACNGVADGASWGLRLAAALRFFFNDRAHLRLGREILEHAMARDGAADDASTYLKSIAGAGNLAFDLGDHDAAAGRFTEALALAKALGDTTQEMNALSHLGNLAAAKGDIGAARRRFDEVLALARQHGAHFHAAAALNELGEVCRLERDFDTAARLYAEALDIHRTHGLSRSTTLLLNLATVAAERDDLAHAWGYLREAAAQASLGGSRYYACLVLDVAAALFATAGDWPLAARAWGASEAAHDDTGLDRQRADVEFVAPRIDRARAALGETAFDEAYAAGRRLSLADATTEVDACLERRALAAHSGA